MPMLHGINTRVWLDGVNLSPYLRSASMAASAGIADTSAFESVWTTALAGQLSATFTAGGMYDPLLVALSDQIAAEARVLTVCPGAGAAIGDAARLLSLDTSAYGESDPLDGVVEFSWDGTAIAAVAVGNVLHPRSKDTNTTTGAAYNGLASSALGFTAHLHVISVDAGGGSWVVTIQDSADGSTGWATIGTFAAKTAAGAERLLSASATTTVRQYVRYVATRTGGSAGDGVTFALAFARSRQ